MNIRRTTLLLMMFFSTLFSYSQIRIKIDSLNTILEQKKTLQDTTRIQFFLDLAKLYRSVDLDSSYLYAQKASALAIAKGFKKGIARADLNIGNYFLNKGAIDSCFFYYRKSQKVYREIGDLDGVHDINYNTGYIYWATGEYDKSIEFYNKDFHYRQEINDTSGIADGFLNIGNVYLAKGNNKKAFESLLESIPYFLQVKDSLSVAKVQSNLGIIQWNFDNYDLALQDFFEALKVFEKEGDRYSMASCFENIAGVYKDLKNFELALKYYRYSFIQSELLDDARLKTSFYFNIGTIKAVLKELDSARYYLRKGEKLALDGDYKDLLSLSYKELGVLHSEKDPEKAIELINKSIRLNEEIGLERFYIVSSLEALGAIYENKKQFSKAIDHYKRGLKIAKEIDSKRLEATISYDLYRIYKALGNTGASLSNLENYRIINDSVVFEETNKSIIAREIQYETAKKEQQIIQLTNEQTLKNAEIKTQSALIKQRSSQRNLLLVVLLGLATISLLLFRNYRTKLKTKELVNTKQKEFEKLRSKFFANISHEFRTPLTLIDGPINDLLAESTDQKSKTNLEIIKRNSHRLKRLINQLLDFSKLEANKLIINKKEVAVFKFLRAITASFSSLAANHDLNYKIEIPSSNKIAFLDEEKIEIVIYNLISNAIKYTLPGGEVYLSVEEKKHGIKITVTDTGIGLDHDDKERIFERYYRSKDGHTIEGTGIGLALSKELIELMNGTIQVESEKGKGTTFIIELPLEITEISSDINIKVAITNDDKNKKEKIKLPADANKILLVEDNEDLRTYIKGILGNHYQLLEAIDGEKGLKIAQKEIPDIIISDLMMPKMEGDELCRLLKSDEKTSHIPFIMLTAKATEEDKIKGLAYGADDYLTKPFDKKELQLKIKNTIEQRMRLQQKLQKELITSPDRENISSKEDRFILKLRDIIVDNLNEADLNISFLCAEMALSRVQLYRKVLALTGLSTSDFIRKIRIQKAAQLLESNWGTISEVAYEVGFNNLSYFTKCFKEFYDQTPSAFLKNK